MFNSYGQTKVGGSDVPLTIFGGVAPEMSEVDLPEGSSAGNQDVDYSLSKVYTRPGLMSLFSYAGLTASKFASFGSSVAIPNSTCGNPWANPNNISNNTPGVYAEALVNADVCSNSQILRATAYNFNLPPTVGIAGMEVVVYGHMTTDSGTGSASLTITPTTPTDGSPTFTFVLPAGDGPVIIATPTSNWGFQLTPAVLDGAGLSFDIVASAPAGTIVTFEIYAVEVVAYLTPNPPQNVNYIKTFAQQSGTDLTLMIDNAGIGWQEDVFGNPGVFNGFYLNFTPGSYAKSVTFQEHEYLALSNLTEGVDMPRQYDGVNVDRISQCAPGVTPVCQGTTNSAATQAIVQVTLTNVAGVPTATVTTQQPIPGLEIGNQFTISGNSLSYWNGTWTVSGTPNAATLSITQTSLLGGVANYTYILITGTAPTTGSQITVTGCTNGPTVGGLSIFDLSNALVSSATANTFSVLIPGVPDVPPDAETGAASVVGTIFQFQPGTASPGPAWNQSINGHTPDNTVVWVNLGAAVAWAPNTSWTGVTYAVENGTNLTSLMWDPPTSCFYVNGSGDGYRAGGHSGNTRPNFNPTPGTFTRGDAEIDWFNIGTPYTNPTQCQIWEANQTQPAGVLTPYCLEPTGAIPLPGQPLDPINPVYLQMPLNFNSPRVTASEIGTGGTLIVIGQQANNLGAGLRGVVLLFQTRNGLITGPSPFIQFNTNEGTTQINCTNIAQGPPDCTARIIAFTPANGSLYYYIPSPVTVISNSQSVTYSATIINDNVTTQANFTFTDAILTGEGSVEIDVPGYNLFNLVELGDCVGIIDYQGRLFAWGEENKVQNFNNLSFNGGYISNGTAILPLVVNGYVPAGWKDDFNFGGGSNLSVSPLFGDSYYIKNTSGMSQAFYGMITQSAYQDIYNVNILNPNFTYGARVVARCPSQIGSGNLVVDLYSPSFMRVFGSYTIPLASMGTTMSRFIGDVLTTAFPISIPTDLILRAYATDLPDGGDVEIDHLEIYPLQQPVLQNQFRASYANQPEMFDGVTGNCGPAQDNKPIGGAVTLFDNLYCMKRNGGGTYVTFDNGITEPSEWIWKTVSTNVGTMGPNSYDYGENWYVSADRKGLYGYGGGPLEKMSQEIQPVWDMITHYPATVVRNDQYQRRILVFACIPTPNIYMPEMPANPNPTTPNVCLAMSYRENDSIEALIAAKPVHQTFMGTIKAFDFVRKWSYWNIRSPYADFCERADTTEQLLIGNGVGNSKIYMLSPTQFSDDGVAINSYYITYGFVRPDTQEAKGLGLGEMQLGLARFLVSGVGDLNIADYPDTTLSTNVQWYFPILLSSVGGPTVEAPLNDIGSRFFIRVGTNAVGDHFLLSKMVVTMDPSPWASVKGTGF